MFEYIKTHTSHERRSDLFWIFLGTAIMACSTNLFYSPAGMIPGGFTGLAIIIRHLTSGLVSGGMPLWLTNIILNVPLIIFSILLRGWKFMRRTFLAALLFSLHLFWIPEYALCPGDPVLTAVFGGALMGVGLGLVLLGKGTTGGTDTLAALLQHALPYVSVAQIIPFLDGAIILLSAFIFGIPVTLYAALSVILQGIVADEITSGVKKAKTAYIISDHYQEIADAIIRELDRSTTMLEGTGMYSRAPKPVLMCAVSKKEIVLLREIVGDTDPDAFFILVNATEVRGEGFLGHNAGEEL